METKNDKMPIEKKAYFVNLHVDLAGFYHIAAESKEDAERIIKERFTNEDIKLRDLDLAGMTVEATFSEQGKVD